jgi:V8-like Glu-specific endopeptidase
MKTSPVRRREVGLLCLSCLVVAIIAVGWVAPAAAASRYAEAPMQVMTEGLTAEEHVLRQVELSRELIAELPEEAVERAIRIPLSSAEVAAIDQGPRHVSPLKIGLVKAMAPEVAVAGLDRGSLDRQPDGSLVWAAVVRADQAGAIRLHVQGLSLPDNARLYVYSRGGQAFGPYTGFGPNGTGSFWTTAVFGSEAILQLRLAGPVRRADLRSVSFRVTEAGLVTRKFANSLRETFEETSQPRQTAEACGNPNCVVDATCINTTLANNAKLGVAKMEWISGAFIFTCTGGLITDTNPTQGNFFLTANHCFSKNNVAQNVSFYWRFATSSCNSTSCPSNGGWPFVTTGSTVSSTNRKSDYTLIRLTSNPPAGSVFLGWTSAPVANSNGAQLFRVSNPNFGPQVYSAHNVDTAVGTCSGWPRGQWIYSRDVTGAIDGGSSGSPVLNASQQVVGQLSGTCGFNPSDPCASGPGEANATVDGAFAAYFATIKPFINP